MEITSVNYYGVFSQNIDPNMSKYASDLYFTQLQELQDLSVIDMRATFENNETPDTTFFPPETFSFYVIITKDENEKWFSTLHLINPTQSANLVKKISYDSYYKILMESKDNIKGYISDLYTVKQEESAKIFNDDLMNTSNKIISTESLSGTWKGRDDEKIVISRGGRGFVSFKNGATMNVTVSFEDTPEGKTVIITQKGKSNASFYPELPRKEALNAALSAEPITWTLSAVNAHTLTGNKKTILQIDSNGNLVSGLINIEWKKVE